jgi:hypothetical protein
MSPVDHLLLLFALCATIFVTIAVTQRDVTPGHASARASNVMLAAIFSLVGMTASGALLVGYAILAALLLLLGAFAPAGG